MNRQKNINSNGIEWCDYTENPIKGRCPNMKCSIRKVCYALKIYDRYKMNPKLRLDEKELLAPLKLKKPSRIFVGSTLELFHPTISDEWIEKILSVVSQCSQHTFLFLTKNPIRYREFSFPLNCQLGTTVNRKEDIWRIVEQKAFTKKERILFVSCEPLHEDIVDELPSLFNWIILGGQSGSKRFYPPEKWIRKIEDKADMLGIKVFEKDNLRKVWDKPPRQEII